MTPSLLMNAAKYCSLEAVKILLAHGADVNAVNTDGESALMHASKRGAHEIVEYLLAKNAEPNLQSRRDETALMLAAESGCTLKQWHYCCSTTLE